MPEGRAAVVVGGGGSGSCAEEGEEAAEAGAGREGVAAGAALLADGAVHTPVEASSACPQSSLQFVPTITMINQLISNSSFQ